MMNTNSIQRPPFLANPAVMGPFCMLAAALMFTVLNLVIKLLGPHYTPWHIGFYRFAGGAAILVLMAIPRTNPYRSPNIRLLVLRGCTGTMAFLCLVTALRLLPVSTALVIFYSFPAFAALFGFIRQADRLGRWELGCIVMTLTGIGVMFGMPKGGYLTGQVVAVLGGILAGLTVTLIRSLRSTNGPVVIYLYFCTMGTLVTFPFYLADPVLPRSLLEWTFVLGIVLLSVGGQLSMNQGFLYCRGWEGGVLMSSEVLFTALAGILFMGDPTGIRFYLGAVLILGSIIALAGIGRTA